MLRSEPHSTFILCVCKKQRQLKVQVRLHICSGSSETLLPASVINTNKSCVLAQMTFAFGDL